VASLAEEVDVALAREQSASPCWRAFLDWCTKEIRWGCSLRSVGADMSVTRYSAVQYKRWLRGATRS
jgi:hypothetical protein